VLLSLGPCLGGEDEEPQVSLPEPTYHFEITGISEPVEHIFQFRNNTKETIETAGIKVTAALAVQNIQPVCCLDRWAWSDSALVDPRPVGDYTGFIEVRF